MWKWTNFHLATAIVEVLASPRLSHHRHRLFKGTKSILEFETRHFKLFLAITSSADHAHATFGDEIDCGNLFSEANWIMHDHQGRRNIDTDSFS